MRLATGGSERLSFSAARHHRESTRPNWHYKTKHQTLFAAIEFAGLDHRFDHRTEKCETEK
jgi:hypothetical protein